MIIIRYIKQDPKNHSYDSYEYLCDLERERKDITRSVIVRSGEPTKFQMSLNYNSQHLSALAAGLHHCCSPASEEPISFFMSSEQLASRRHCTINFILVGTHQAYTAICSTIYIAHFLIFSHSFIFNPF